MQTTETPAALCRSRGWTNGTIVSRADESRGRVYHQVTAIGQEAVLALEVEPHPAGGFQVLEGREAMCDLVAAVGLRPERVVRWGGRLEDSGLRPEDENRDAPEAAE